MTYEAPKLFVLNVAADAVRGGSDGGSGTSGDSSAHKKQTVHETAENDNGMTSSTGSAYEADE